MINFFLSCFLLFSTLILAEKAPLSVLIVGGGPTGLACAIEAAADGCNVTIIEKRSEYTRSQPLILTNNTLNFLKKWDILIPGIIPFTIDEEKNAFIRIKSLEKHLVKKCDELNIQKVLGEFQGFEGKQKIHVKTSEEDLILPYDLLVACDGFHSKIRESLSIPMTHLGSAKGAYIAICDLSDPNHELILTNILRTDSSFMRIIKLLSFITVVSIQSPLEATKNQIQYLLKTQGYQRQAKNISQEKIIDLVENIPLALSQAQTFYDLEQSVILLGDASLSVSFLLAEGLNTAFSSLTLIPDLLRDLLNDKKKAFENFNRSMKALTDEVIERERLLFPDT